MQPLKITIITVSFNAETTIERCIQSVASQTYVNIEYIVIDGRSTDNTLKIIRENKNVIHVLISERDNGIYDAMNKGLDLASGSVVGMLNADDWFTDNEVLKGIAAVFENSQIQMLYGDLDYVDNQGKILRKWRSGNYLPNSFNRGWMPPHPTFYCRKELFDKFGYYRLDFGTAADYELMVRFIHKQHQHPYYLQKVLVKMQAGGASNKNLASRLHSLQNDLRAMRINGIRFPLAALIAKPLRKLGQYF